MPNENENLNSLNEKFSITDFENLEGDELKAKLQEFGAKHDKVLDVNRQFYARAKKAEGFEQNEKGEWIKQKPEPKEEKVKPDEGLLKRLDTMALRVSGIQAEDEVELFNKWKEDTGRDADAIIGNTIFQKELADLRTAKANADATNVKGGGSSSASKGTLEEQADYWISKSTKDSKGAPLFSDEMPNNYKLHAAIVRRLNETSKDKKKFYNS